MMKMKSYSVSVISRFSEFLLKMGRKEVSLAPNNFHHRNHLLNLPNLDQRKLGRLLNSPKSKGKFQI